MSFERIENDVVIGNVGSIALVGMNGSMDFLCYPDFDSPTVFVALLGDEHAKLHHAKRCIFHHAQQEVSSGERAKPF